MDLRQTFGLGCHMLRHFCGVLYRSQATSGAGCVAALAEVRKQSKYSFLPTTYQFQPVAIETSGVVGPSTRAFLKDLGRRVRWQTGEAMATSYLLQRISMAVQRGHYGLCPSALNLKLLLEWNLRIVDTIGTHLCVHCREVVLYLRAIQK